MADQFHKPVPRHARPSEAPAKFICKVCGRALEQKRPDEGKAGGYQHLTPTAQE